MAWGGEYTVAKADEPALLAAMQNEKFDLPARLCAARFLLELTTPRPAATSRRALVPRTVSAREAAYVLAAVRNPQRLGRRRDDPRGPSRTTPYDATSAIDRRLGQWKVKEAVPALIEALKRWPGGILDQGAEAAVALGEIGDPTAIPALLETVELEGRLQFFQAHALYQLNSDKLLPILLRHLDNDSVVTLLDSMKDRRAIGPIEEALRQGKIHSVETRDQLQVVLAKLQAKDPADLATRLLKLLAEQSNSIPRPEPWRHWARPATRGPSRYSGIGQNHEPLRSAERFDHALGTINNNKAIAGLIDLLGRDYSNVKTGKPLGVTFPKSSPAN